MLHEISGWIATKAYRTYYRLANSYIIHGVSCITLQLVGNIIKFACNNYVYTRKNNIHTFC